MKNIEIFEEEDILGNVQKVTPHFQRRLQQLVQYPIVGDVRGMGLLGCIEGRPDQYGYTLVEERKLGALLDKACEEMGLLVRPLINMAVFSPPLVINTSQIDDMFDILDKALKKVSQI